MSDKPFLPGQRCPACRALIDDATAAYEAHARPQPGDVTVCAYCSVVMVFDGDPLTVRLPTRAERQELLRIPKVAAVERASRDAREQGGVPTRRKLN